jgi:hypothetical protein
MADRTATRLDDLARELDLVVFSLERPPKDDPSEVLKRVERARREIERLRDALIDLSRTL